MQVSLGVRLLDMGLVSGVMSEFYEFIARNPRTFRNNGSHVFLSTSRSDTADPAPSV